MLSWETVIWDMLPRASTPALRATAAVVTLASRCPGETDSATLAESMYVNDFKRRVGHRFTFRMPANPKADFDGIVRCEVLECEPPSRLAYSWSGSPGVVMRVSYRLEPDGD